MTQIKRVSTWFRVAARRYRRCTPVRCFSCSVSRSLMFAVALQGGDSARRTSRAYFGVAVGLLGFGLLLCSCVRSVETGSLEEVRRQFQRNTNNVAVRANLVEKLSEAGAYSEAVSLGEEGLAQHPDDIALLKSLSMAQSYWSSYGGAPEHRKPAEDLLTKLIEFGAVDSKVYSRLGWIQSANGKKGDALKSYETAYGLDPNDVYVLRLLGFAYTEAGKYEKAIPLLQRATALLAQSSERLRAPTWAWLGNAQRMAGDYASSVSSLEKGYELAPKADKEEFKVSLDYTRTLMSPTASWEAYRAHSGLGEKHQSMGRHDRAVAEYQQALDLTPAFPEADANSARGYAHSNLAYVLSLTGQRERDLEHSIRAVEFFKKGGAVEQLAWAYQHLGYVYGRAAGSDGDSLVAMSDEQKQEYWDSAVKACEESQALYRSGGFAKRADSVRVEETFYLFERYGVSDPRVKEMRKANLVSLPAEGPIADPDQVQVALSECTYLELEHEYDACLALALRLMAYFDSVSTRSEANGSASFYELVAKRYLLQHKDIDTGLMYLEKARAVAEMTRNQTGNDRFKRGAAGFDFEFTSQWLVYWNVQKGDFARAFDCAENYKGRALLDLLSPESISRKRVQTKRDEAQESQLLARMDNLKKEMAAVRSHDAAATRNIERDLTVEQTRYERLKEDVSAAKIELMSVESANVAKWKDIQPLLKGITLVSFVTERGIQNNAIIANENEVVGLSLTGWHGANLRRWVAAFRSDLGIKTSSGRDLKLERDDPASENAAATAPSGAHEDASAELYKHLIEPILPYLKTEVVYISPSSILNYLPFEALRDKDGHYLIESHAIAYTPSANVLKLCMEKERHRKDSVLAFGNPNLLNPQFRLANAEKEVAGLQGLFPKVDVFTFDNATESAFKKHAADYDILHLACHGELNHDDPMLTSLRLTPDAENDGYLHAGEVFDMNLSASLVVLSSCNSALGELSTGNEMMGLTRSFLYAGVPSIVASLWTVDDRSTAALMEQFYKNLATMNKAEALRQAKLTTMKEYPSPFHWAPFCLQGDYR